MTTIFDALRVDHDRQRELIEKLVATTGSSDDRRTIFEDLKLELEAHARHEERQFYVPLMERDLTQEKARHSVAEHKELDDFVERLVDYDMSAPQWLTTAEELKERLEHHLAEEEREVFPLAGRALSDTEKEDLGDAYESSMASERESADA